jgi:hypothetical protein
MDFALDLILLHLETNQRSRAIDHESRSLTEGKPAVFRMVLLVHWRITIHCCVFFSRNYPLVNIQTMENHHL